LKPKHIILAAIFVLVIFCYWRYEQYSQDFYLGLLPKGLEISGSVIPKDQSSLTGGCGIVIFKLSKNTLNKIAHQKLSFFKDLTKAKDSSLDKHNLHYSYSDWQETPLQETRENKNFGLGLSCSKLKLDEDLYKRIDLGAKTKGSYYTGHQEGQIVVIPSMGIAVLSYVD
jgi:hypothetical protein